MHFNCAGTLHCLCIRCHNGRWSTRNTGLLTPELQSEGMGKATGKYVGSKAHSVWPPVISVQTELPIYRRHISMLTPNTSPIHHSSYWLPGPIRSCSTQLKEMRAHKWIQTLLSQGSLTHTWRELHCVTVSTFHVPVDTHSVTRKPLFKKCSQVCMLVISYLSPDQEPSSQQQWTWPELHSERE